ncbi:hypothetical protein [Nostoc sp. UHCC 0251]|uniref:hypothetical protein n=1 Tax=Nostoc sp. UHCC 0251 TaxID=3110240 RepID=UPI002B1FAF0D|nr:hypothetical protein [Nostoc sp. UHCC 0251]MEA5625782.1 hypothetical protein [Nostoc sp. UHCC 0251]
MLKRIVAPLITSIGLLSLNASVALSADGNITASLVGQALALSALNYKAALKAYYDVLPGNTYTFIKYNLTRGYNYNMIASCDDNECQDLDLLLLDRDGNEIDSDKGNSTNAKVGLLVRESDTYQLVVIMRGCRKISCEYGVQLLYQEK